MALLATAVEAQSIDLTQYVLPGTGDTDGGNTFPGVSEPFGMVKLGPDLYTGSDSYSGYASSGNFTGFSMMHESGTGGAPKYGVVSQMPVLGNITNPLNDHNDTRSSPDLMEVGYYKAELGSNITVELSATSRAGLYQYTFTEGGGTPNIIVDVSHVLPSYRGQGLSQQYTSGNITILSDGHYEGFGVYKNGWNLAPDWTIYFCGYFDSPVTYKTFTGLNETSSILAQYDDANSVFSTARLGAVFSFASATTVVSRIGVSFISSTQACSNVQSQIPDGTALSSVTSQTKSAWNTEILSKITTTETNTTQLELLYSSLYHMHLMPSNRTGENPLWKSTEPYYDDTFTLWDLFRCGTSLMHIINPTAYEEYIRSLIDIFRFEGYMPDARSSNFNGAIQGGTNSDNVLADAYVKGVRGAINWQDGFAAMVKNAEIAPLNNNDTRDLSSSTKEGRGALSDYATLGYITPKYGRSVTRAIEYSVNDFSLYQVAVGLNKTESATKYVLRSRNWRNHWYPNATSLNFTGFVVPRSQAGFIAQDPLSCAGCYWGDAYYEALPWEYSFSAHHDINTLIALSGGPTTFTSRLEAMFTPGINTSGRSAGFNNTIFNPGNEPSFTTPYLYNYVGRQDLSVKRSRFVAKTYYSATPGGLPGNSDSGAMESWVIWNILGLYPMVGQTTFLIGSPWFANTTISLGSGKSLSMTTVNGSETSFYVQSLQVNGVSWNQSWLTWDHVFANGGTMDFVMGPNPAKWDIGPAPPSPASEFSDTASPNTIVPPSTVSNSPSPAQMLESAKHRRMLRDVAFGMMVVGIVGISTAGFLWWYLRRKKQKISTALTAANTIEDKKEKKEESDQSRGTTANSDRKQESLDWVKRRWHNFSIGDRQKGRKSSASDASTLVGWALGRVHKRSPSDEEKGGHRSTKSDTSTLAPKEDGEDEKKAPLTIAVLGVPSGAQEPWTPNGINRRMGEEEKED